MKCARCGHDATYPQRQGGACPSCKGRFAFEPRTGDPLSDMAWKSALDQVSSGGTVRFTLANLHHAVARRMKVSSSAPAGWVFIALGAAGLVAGLLAETAALAVVALVLAAIGAALVATKRTGLALDEPTFRALHQRWVAAHGAPPRLIAPRPTPRLPAPAVAQELESYSFDRAVVCDRPETVDLLLGNDFHFENNCAVLTADGYPRHAFDVVRKMLRQNPRLEVFVLHDATPDGCTLAHTLKTDPDWFGNRDVRVYDVALRPAQAAKHPTLVVREPRAVEPHPALTEDERLWLAAYTLSVAAFSPEQTIKRLFRAINRMPELAEGGGDGGGGGGGDAAVVLWATDAHASDGGGDSFG